MKKLIILILLFPALCFGGPIQDAQKKVIARKNAVVACYDCSGTASFLWECNSTTVGDTGFSPCGCVSSGEDDIAASSGNVSIADGTCIFNDTSANGLDTYYFDNGTDGLSDDTVGTVFIRFKITTWGNDDVSLFNIYEDADNYIQLRYDTSDELAGRHRGNATAVNVVTTDSPLSTGVEYIARFRWRTADLDPNLTVNVYLTSMEEQGSGASDNTNCTAFANQAGVSDFKIGNFSSNTGSNVTIYYVHTYGEWLDADPN